MAERYLVRKYGATTAHEMIRMDTISELDRKVILSMERLQKAYKKCYENKVQTVLIEYQRQPMFDQAVLKTTVPEKAVSKKKAVPKECRAIKMSGEKCTAKIKCGDFCARHTKK